MLDAEVRVLLDLMEKAEKDGRPKLHTLPYAKGRAEVDKMSEDCEAAPPEVAATIDGTIPVPAAAIKFRRYRPLGVDGTTLPTLIYYHGGGWVIGNIETHDSTCRRLANKSRCQVISVDYRLAPEHPFPAALDDAVAATAWTCGHATDLGAAAGPVVIGGESAGGNLAAVTCLQARLDPRIAIRCQILLQPVVDFALTFPSIAMKATECLVPRDDLAWYYDTYAGATHDKKDWRLSPLYATDLSGLPPALIIAAEYDTLRDEAGAYAERLQAARVPAHCSCYPGMIHGFLQMGGLVPDARAALAEIARAIN
jgi:acetyl esterase